MPSFGERLKEEREARRTTIEEISVATGIQLGYLQALENDEFHALPGRAFGKLYIRAYAKTLGFDPRLLIDIYDRERKARCQDLEEPADPVALVPPQADDRDASDGPRRGPAPSSRRLVLILLFLGLLAGAAGVVIVLRRAGVAQAAPQIVEAAPPSVVPDRETPPARPAETPPSPPPMKAVTRQSEVPGRLTVPEFGVGRRIVSRRLEEPGERFAEGDVVWFSTRVLGAVGGESIRHVWIREGRVQQSIKLDLGGPDWRTHSRKTIYGVGQWAVEARDGGGRVLAKATFTCTRE